MPDARRELIKPGFKQHYEELLGKERYASFENACFTYLRKSIRVNTLKTTVEALQERLAPRWHLEPVPWCPEGFWITYKGDAEQEQRFDIGNLPEHALGHFYVQDAASMLPPVILGPEPGELVLDLCAAPGSKTSQMAAMMRNEGLIIANDVQATRLPALSINLQRVGAKNCVVTKMLGQRFGKKGVLFDKVLVDAPCSGTGTVRKSMKVLEMWSPRLVQRIAKEQQKLAQAGFDALRPGGVMVYSTCTLEPAENEGVVSWLLERNKDASLIEIQLPLVRTTPITRFQEAAYREDVALALRIHPEDNDTEGFFVAKIKKASR